jgi:hypothetical protein
MDEPLLHQYCANDRAELFDFIREVHPPEVSARLLGQWRWKFEEYPFNEPERPATDIIRIGGKLVGLLAGFRLKVWMGGIECFAENRGAWIVHPDYRGQYLWRQVMSLPPLDTPIRMGWTRLPPRVQKKIKWLSDPVRPLLRVLNAGALVAHYTHLPGVTSIGTAASAAARLATAPFRSRPDAAIIPLDAFDDRVDSLWERARPAAHAMVIRDHRYLNWRYCQRPNADYLLYGLERAAKLDGFLVARVTTRNGIRWGYLIDFMAADSSRDLAPLVRAAIDEFRRHQVAAVSCYATDPAARAALFRLGFFPVVQRKPIRFVRFFHKGRTDLAKFAAISSWYLTMGDGDLEMDS